MSEASEDKAYLSAPADSIASPGAASTAITADPPVQAFRVAPFFAAIGLLGVCALVKPTAGGPKAILTVARPTPLPRPLVATAAGALAGQANGKFSKIPNYDGADEMEALACDFRED